MVEKAIPGGYVGVWRGGKEPQNPRKKPWWHRFLSKKKPQTEKEILTKAAEKRAKAARRQSKGK